MPSLWEAASVESCWGDVPAAGFEYQPHETGFHPNVGLLSPVERAMAELWIKSVIKPFGLLEELLIRKKENFWSYIAQKKRFTLARMSTDQIGF